MHKQTIALVDDDRNILTSLSIALEKEGFKVQTYIDGESALIGLTRNPPDLAILDIKMPRMDGEELLKKLKKKMSIPIIFLTSKDDEVDELLGWKLGADDFVKKSGGFSTKVLIERIRVQLRKKIDKVEDSKNIITHGKLKLDPSQLECEWNGKALPDKLTTTEFLIVKELIAASKNDNSLTTIILSATLIDVIKNENSKIFQNLSGVEINLAFSSCDANWLRQRRNEVIHHKGPTDGLLGNDDGYKKLSMDANKSIKIISNLLNMIMK